MRILVTGNGQLAQALKAQRVEESYNELLVLGKREMDIVNSSRVKEVIETFEPELVYHTAGWNDVDGCEERPEKAYKINSLGTRNVAVATEKVGGTLIYISSDYVFSGEKGQGYHEFDNPCPINVYGHSKLKGEDYVKDLVKKHFIVRTGWLFADNGNSFLNTVSQLAWQGQDLKVVNDQIGSPTYCNHLAQTLNALTKTELYGTYHIVNPGATSWFLLAKALLRELGLNPELIEPISSHQLLRKAQRPVNSTLISYTEESAGLSPLPSWRDALREWAFKERESLKKSDIEV